MVGEGFDGAPRYLGEDGLGRDILTFVPGEVPAKWRAFDDEQVATGAARSSVTTVSSCGA